MSSAGHRAGLTLLLAATLFAASGATCIEQINRPPLTPQATLDEVLAVLDQQSTPLQKLEADQAKITVQVDQQAFPSLNARLAAERPQRLRLIGETSFTGKEIDLGSNDELFWFWVRRNEPPALFYCRHTDFANSGLRQQFGIDPAGVTEALGFGALRYGDQVHSMKRIGKGRIELQAMRETPAGRFQKLVRMDERVGWVLEQFLYDERGTLLASSTAQEHQKDPYTGVVVPQRVDINWPAAKLTLKLNLGFVRINGTGGDASLWTLPRMDDYGYIDLAKPPQNNEQ